MDAKLANTNEITAARMGALTDWINGGRLDLILDDILLDTAEIGAAGAGLTNVNLPNQTMDIVGNITGNLSGSAGSVTGAVGSVTGNVGGNVVGTVDSVVGAVGSVTGNVGGNVTGTVGGFTVGAKAEIQQEAEDAHAAVGLTTTVTGRIDAAISTRMATYAQPTGFLASTFPATVASTTNITGGTITTVTNLTNAPTAGDFTATMKTSLNAATPAVTVSDKTGFKLASDGLNLIVPADPSAIPVLGTANIVTWIGYFGAWSVNEVNSDADSVNLRNSADSTDLAAHPTSDNGTTFSSGEAV